MPMYNPPHPGEVIQTEVLEANGLSLSEMAEALGISGQALSGLLKGKVGLSGEMAVRIEKVFGPKMETLMGMQSAYDISQVRQQAGSIRVGR